MILGAPMNLGTGMFQVLYDAPNNTTGIRDKWAAASANRRKSLFAKMQRRDTETHAKRGSPKDFNPIDYITPGLAQEEAECGGVDMLEQTVFDCVFGEGVSGQMGGDVSPSRKRQRR